MRTFRLCWRAWLAHRREVAACRRDPLARFALRYLSGIETPARALEQAASIRAASPATRAAWAHELYVMGASDAIAREVRGLP